MIHDICCLSQYIHVCFCPTKFNYITEDEILPPWFDSFPVESCLARWHSSIKSRALTSLCWTMWIRAIALIRGKHNSGATNCQLVCSGGAHKQLTEPKFTDGHRFTYTYDDMSGYPRAISSQPSKAFVNAWSPNHNPKTSENCVRWVLSSDQVVDAPLIGIAYCICFSPKSVRIAQAEHCKKVRFSKNNCLTLLHMKAISSILFLELRRLWPLPFESNNFNVLQDKVTAVSSERRTASAARFNRRHACVTMMRPRIFRAAWPLGLWPYLLQCQQIVMDWIRDGKRSCGCDFQRTFFPEKKTWDRRRFVCWVGGSQMCFFFHPQHEASRYFEGTSGTGHYHSWHF